MRIRFALPVLAFTLLARGQAEDPCHPSAEVKAALEALPLRSIHETSWEYQQRRGRALEDLLRRYPGDMFIERAYNGMVQQTDWENVNSDNKKRHEQKPDDPKAAFLYGLTLEGRNSAEAIQVLEAALAKSPGYPWPHRPLSRIYAAPAFLNKEKSVGHIKAFLDACPAEVGAYQQLTTVGDKALLTDRTNTLRTIVEKRTDAEAVAGYQTLWALEFKTHAGSEYPAVRKQISQDLERIRSLALVDKQQWYAALQAGYKLVNDDKQADWAADELERRLPQPGQLRAMQQWNKEHPYPKPEDPAGKKRELFAERLQQTKIWLKERPMAVGIWGARFDSLAHLDDTPAKELDAAGEEYLAFADRDAGPKGATSWAYRSVAEALAKRHVNPTRVLELARKGLARLEIINPPSDLYRTKDNEAEYEFYKPSQFLDLSAIEARALLDLKNSQEAKAVLARMDERQRSIQKIAGTKEEYKSEYAGWMSRYWGLMARAAELEQHQVDAMTFYTNALLARLDSSWRPESGMNDELADSARQLWTKLGGTREGWNEWYGRRADSLVKQSAIVWEPVSQPLAAFDLTDVKGKPWNLGALKGKVNFLNFWASW